MIFDFAFEHDKKATDQVVLECLLLHMRDGSDVLVDWDESDYTYYDNETECRLKGISFNGQPADGKLDWLSQNLTYAKPVCVSLKDEDDVISDILVTQLNVRDGRRIIAF